MRTADEALADCLALGQSRAMCTDKVRSQMVGGVYCDGTIVITAEGHRCVPRETVDRVNVARAASPLSSETTSKWIVGGVVLAVVALAVWAARS